MSTMPIDSVYGIPEPPRDAHPDVPVPALGNHRAAPDPDQAEAPANEVEWVNSELHTIASTIEELQGRLEEANARLESASNVETTEFEIGRLFVEAQRFSEASLSKLDLKIREILCEAEAKAKEILAEATEEAHEIRRQAQQAAFAATGTARELQTAIAGFTAVNNELLKELGSLNHMLTPVSDPMMSEIESSGEAESD